jgi:Holliday junction resolvase-like predicted endonuclease
VNKQKRQRLKNAAAHYLQLAHRDNISPFRSDVIAIEDDSVNACIDWINNAV